jgi:hypothetical protein
MGGEGAWRRQKPPEGPVGGCALSQAGKGHCLPQDPHHQYHSCHRTRASQDTDMLGHSELKSKLVSGQGLVRGGRCHIQVRHGEMSLGARVAVSKAAHPPRRNMI